MQKSFILPRQCFSLSENDQLLQLGQLFHRSFEWNSSFSDAVVCFSVGKVHLRSVF